jgi:hypothetical protein
MKCIRMSEENRKVFAESKKFSSHFLSPSTNFLVSHPADTRMCNQAFYALKRDVLESGNSFSAPSDESHEGWAGKLFIFRPSDDGKGLSRRRVGRVALHKSYEHCRRYDLINISTMHKAHHVSCGTHKKKHNVKKRGDTNTRKLFHFHLRGLALRFINGKNENFLLH